MDSIEIEVVSFAGARACDAGLAPPEVAPERESDPNKVTLLTLTSSLGATLHFRRILSDMPWSFVLCTSTRLTQRYGPCPTHAGARLPPHPPGPRR